MLFFGVLFLCLAVLLFVIMFVACRNPIPSKWVSEDMAFIFWGPLDVFLLAIGLWLALFSLTMETASVEMKDFAFSFLVILSTIGTVWYIKPRQKLKLYSSQSGQHSKA